MWLTETVIKLDTYTQITTLDVFLQIAGKPKPVQEEVDRKQCKDQSASAANLFQNNPLASQSPEVPRRPRSRSSIVPLAVH